MNRYLTTTALVTVLVLGGFGIAEADTQSQNQSASEATALKPLEHSVDNLRQAQQLLSKAGQGDQQQAFQQARQAVSQAQDALNKGSVAMQGKNGYDKAKQQLSEAADALKGDQPNRQQAVQQLREATDALASFAGMPNNSL